MLRRLPLRFLRVIAALALVLDLSQKPVLLAAEDLKSRYTKASQIFKEGDLDEAQRLFSEIIRDHPSFAYPYYHQGLIHLRRDEPEEAMQFFEKAVTLGADDANLFYVLATAQTRWGELEPAKKNYIKALERNPKMMTACHDLGLLYYRTGELEKAEQVLRKALALDPGSSKTMLLLGMTHIKDQKPELAIELVTSLRELPDETKAAHLESLIRRAQVEKRIAEPELANVVPGGLAGTSKPPAKTQGPAKAKGLAGLASSAAPPAVQEEASAQSTL